MGCRQSINDRTPTDYFNWEGRKQMNFTDNIIVQFVRNNLKEVDGFVDENGDLNQDDLISRLRDDITQAGILGEALEDEAVQEIQINDIKTVWVIKGGKAYHYVDKNGKPFQFISDEELRALVDRLIYTSSGHVPRMTQANPLLNTRTANKGYRLSAVDSSAITRDLTPGFDFPVTSVTIRKYSPSMLTFSDFERSRTLTPEMSDALRKCGKADIKMFCVGPTSSGKTTLLNSVAWEIPEDQRIILIQNPTEIMLYDRDPDTGVNRRNALHWEARDIDARFKDDPTTNSMSNLIAHALRNTPDVMLPGEIRTAAEFEQVKRGLQTGQRVLSTFHAFNGVDAVDRFSTELATLGGNITDHAKSLVSSIDIIVSQRKLADGLRHVMSIEQLTGRLDPDTGRAETIVLFRFVLEGKVVKDKDGKITEVLGYFEQVSPITEDLAQKFYAAGITSDELDFLLHPIPRVEGGPNLPSEIAYRERLKAVGSSVHSEPIENLIEFDEDEDTKSALEFFSGGM